MTINLGIVGGYFRLLPVIFLERDANILHLFANITPPIGDIVFLVDSPSILHRFEDLNSKLLGSNPLFGFYIRDDQILLFNHKRNPPIENW